MSQVTQIGGADVPLTMSSKEIAKLTGKAHTHVIRDIRVILKELGDEPNLVHVAETKDSRGYTKEFRLPRRETDILLTGYSVTLRAKVIDRWRELEAQVAKPAPVANLNDPASLRTLLLGYTEQVMQLEHQVGAQAEKIAKDKPKVEYHDAVKASEHSQTMLQVANKYGIGRTKLFRFLRENGILRDVECSPPYQRFIDSGHFEVDPRFFKRDGKFVHYTQTKVTGKGDIYIGKLLRKAGLINSGE